ncbi:cytochrome b561 [Bradyrhizobium diazoefficiens]|uniref:Putative cytochrome B561 n=2 Tax=Bradyrhizobium diazoefficiens TaxID=1355477 RepID=A0A0E4FXB8_9BRAD|nr:putative cytochrome B561 [Bradyrhizobium diazoefficiens]
MIHDVAPTNDKYPAALRILHWVRALLTLGLIAAGWMMTVLADTVTEKFTLLYPWHKSFGVLVFLIVLAQLAIRAMSRLPGPAPLPAQERLLSQAVHVAMYALLLLVPLMGYAMSSSFTDSDGVSSSASTFLNFCRRMMIDSDCSSFCTRPSPTACWLWSYCTSPVR